MAADTDTAIGYAKAARAAALALQNASSKEKSLALQAIRRVLSERKADIFAANRIDMQHAKEEVEAGRMAKSMYQRLDIEGPNGEKFESVLQGIDDVDCLPDPTGKFVSNNVCSTMCKN